MVYDNLFKNCGIEVVINQDDFLKIKETLTRIGIPSQQNRILTQSCHILHKRDPETSQSRYAIVHFKEMFILDGKPSSLSQNDIDRRNAIVKLLSDWKLIEIKDNPQAFNSVNTNIIKVIPFKEKSMWILISKYSIG